MNKNKENCTVIDLRTVAAKEYVATFISLSRDYFNPTITTIETAINRMTELSETLQTSYLKVNHMLKSFREMKTMLEEGKRISISRKKKWPNDVIDVYVDGEKKMGFVLDEDEDFEYFIPLFLPEENTFSISRQEFNDFIEIFQSCGHRDMNVECAILAAV